MGKPTGLSRTRVELMALRVLPVVAMLAACGDGGGGEAPWADADGTPASGPIAPQAAQPISPLEESSQLLDSLAEPWFGDFDEMVERRIIRAIVVYSKTFYFLDGPTQRGASYEALKKFERQINKRLKTGRLPVHVIVIPVRRDELISALVEGRADLAVANLTITPGRAKAVDFSEPIVSGVSEIVVSGPAAPLLSSLDDLAGREIHARASSSYYESLRALSDSFVAAGKEPLDLVAADEHLEDEDLLEMVSAGLLPLIVMDSHKAKFWAQIFENIRVHPKLAVRSGREIAWAFRKNTPKVREAINRFVSEHKKGALFGNVIIRRYLQRNKWVRNNTAVQERERFNEVIDLFRRYAARYDFDYLMLAAQAYQESRLDQSARSPAGAIGVMQLLPSTAADPNVGIANIEELENNVHAGVKYLRFIHDRYFAKDEIDQLNRWLFSFAAYNAGPRRVQQLRRQTAEIGLDPNVWFRNVEVAAARHVGREPVQYVSNIYKYYVAYRQLVDGTGSLGRSAAR